jgi:hypothetical protein
MEQRIVSVAGLIELASITAMTRMKDQEELHPKARR